MTAVGLPMLNLILSRRGCSQLQRETTQEFVACRPTKPREEVARMRKSDLLAVFASHKLQSCQFLGRSSCFI